MAPLRAEVFIFIDFFGGFVIIKNMEKNKIIVFALAVILVIAGFLIFGKNEKPQTANIGAIIDNATTTDSQLTNKKMNKQGVEIEILKEGTGAVAKSGDNVSVHYVGTLENGTKFDSSIDRGAPFTFTLGVKQVIPGWDIGVEGMKVGEKRKLTIPSELAYGSRGAGAAIPPNATLIFEVELLGIK